MKKERIEKVVITNICLIYKGNKVLVQERTKKDWPGLTFPGGHVKKHENFNESIIREVKEETGLTILKPILCGIEEFKILDKEERHIILYYKCNKFKGKLISSKEGKVYWINSKDLFKKNISLDLDLMYKIMKSDSLSELIYYKENGKYKKKIV